MPHVSEARSSVYAAVPSALREIEINYAKAGTLFAHFEQENESVAMKTKKKSSGEIVIKKPNKLRWQTTAPDPNLLVSDGKRAWFYTPPFDETEHGQYAEYPANKIRSRLASTLLSGEFSKAKDLTIRAVSKHEFVLKPRAGTAGTVREARVEIDPIEKKITRVQLIHEDGNRTDIHLSDINLGQSYGDDVFVFKAPPNTDKVQQ